jgi:hypothetical protein
MRISAAAVASLKLRNEQWDTIMATSKRFNAANSDTAPMFDSWTTSLNSPKDLTAMIQEHPEASYLLCNIQNKMYIVHSMRTETDLTGPENETAYYGVLGNKIRSPFMEVIITSDTFKWKKPKPDNKTETPTPIVTQTEDDTEEVITDQPDHPPSSSPPTKETDKPTKETEKKAKEDENTPKTKTNKKKKTTPKTKTSNESIRSIFPVPPWIASQILELKQPFEQNEVKEKLTYLLDQINENATTDPVETAIARNIISKMKLFVKACTQKNLLHKTYVMPIMDEMLNDELFEDNIPEELLQLIIDEETKKGNKEQSEKEEESDEDPEEPDNDDDSDKDSHQDQKAKANSSKKSKTVNFDDKKKKHKTESTNKELEKSSTSTIIQALITRGDVSAEYIIDQLLQDKNDTTKHLVSLSKDLYSERIPKKANIFDNLPSNQQLVLLRGQVKNHFGDQEEPTTLFPTCTEVFESTAKAKAATTFHNLLFKNNGRGEYQRGHITTIAHGGPVWSNRNYPEGLTIFAIHPSADNSIENRQKEEIASIKAAHDNHLDNGEVLFLAKKSYHFPSCAYEMEQMIKTFVIVLALLFGPASLVARSVRVIQDHIQNNFDIYLDQHKERPNWSTRVLFAIDNNVQSYLRKLQSPEPIEQISSHNIQQNLQRLIDDIENRSLAVTIPTSIANLRGDHMNKQKDNNNNHNNQYPDSNNNNNGKRRRGQEQNNNNNFINRNNQQGQGNQHNNGNQQGNNNRNNANVAENPKKNPKWILPSGKMFGELFHKNADLMQSAPKHNDKPFCLQYFTKGHCLRGSHCNLSHTDPRDCGLEAAMNALCVRAYA